MSDCGTSVDWTKQQAMDHVVLVLFENRSFDNLLGHLYTEQEKPGFEGVLGKTLSNPVPEWEGLERVPTGEPGCEENRVRYGPVDADNVNVPNPDPGEEYPHTNTQIYNVLRPENRFEGAHKMMLDPNMPRPEDEHDIELMGGFVTDYVSQFKSLRGMLPTYAEYKQIMRGLTPEHVPVLSEIARNFVVFDHWFSEVPSQTFPNRSYWTAASSAGFVINSPVWNWYHRNLAPTIFERLEECGRTWKVYVLDSPLSVTGAIHHPRLADRFADNFVPYDQFEIDVRDGTLPDFAVIEPNLLAGHGDYHPPMGEAMAGGIELPVDWVKPIDAGERFLATVYNAVKGAPREVSPADGRSCFWNTALFIGWDEPGGTYDHVPPAAAVPPGDVEDRQGFDFTRSGYRVPAILVSPWVEAGAVEGAPEGGPDTLQYRHTSMINTLRHRWDLGPPLTRRDADDSAARFDHLFSLPEPRSQWPDIPIPDAPVVTTGSGSTGQFVGALGRHLVHGLSQLAHVGGHQLEGDDVDPDRYDPRKFAPYGKLTFPTKDFLEIVRAFGGIYFPRLQAARPSDPIDS